MVKKKVDPRVMTLLQSSVATNTRSLLLLIGDNGKDQIPNLHHILSRTSVGKPLPPVLWCYKKDLGFSSHKMKRMKRLKKLQKKGLVDGDGMDNFELFLSGSDITWCYYKDTPRVLGRTYGVLVLQDFEALTPNILARTVETVAGGGLVVFLLRSVTSLKQVYAMSMDVHARYRTEGGGDVVPRFNERFILSLAHCDRCLVCDDELNVLPLSREVVRGIDEGTKNAVDLGGDGEVIVRESRESRELEELKRELLDVPHVGALVSLAKTLDQGKALLQFLEACSDKSSQCVALTAARGRGKSAAIGLCLAGAVSFQYSNIVVTAPAPENLVAVFEFVIKGLTALKYREHLDFSVTYNGASGREETKCVIAIDIHRDHRQVIKYVSPTEPDKFASAELVAIDEAAAIPLPTVRSLISEDRLTFLSSTVNGYEGTGRALSLKLLKDLRDGRVTGAVLDAAEKASSAVVGPKTKKKEAAFHEKKWAAAATAAKGASSTAVLRELTLTTPIRYATGDAVESWLHSLLCLDTSSSQLKLHANIPSPSDTDLYLVDRDALFSHHALSESFLQKMMGLYTAAHYKNSPNDLQMLSDAPSHAVFVLLNVNDQSDNPTKLPDILAVIQVALEGNISRKTVQAQLARGHRAAGDLMPWTISQQFNDSNFAKLSGARIVRVAVHPNLQGMGYGTRAVEIVTRYYNGELINTGGEESDSDNNDSDSESSANSATPSGKGLKNEKLAPRTSLPPLLQPVSSVSTPPPQLDWIGTSFGITPPLHKFWKKNGFHLLYMRQTKNELTGEHTAIVAKALPRRTGYDDAWLYAFRADVKRRIVTLLGGPFQKLPVSLALGVVTEECGSGGVGEGEDVAAGDENPATKELRKRGASDSLLTVAELEMCLTPYDLKRLELYGRNLCDHHLITDLLPPVSRLYFLGRLKDNTALSAVQEALLCGVGLQLKTIDVVSAELGLPLNQTLAMFNKSLRKLSMGLNKIVEESFAKEDDVDEKKKKELKTKLNDVTQRTLEQDEQEGSNAVMEQFQNSNNLPIEISKDAELMRYTVKGTEEQWSKALEDGDTKRVQMPRKSNSKRKEFEEHLEAAINSDPKMLIKQKKKKKKKGKH